MADFVCFYPNFREIVKGMLKTPTSHTVVLCYQIRFQTLLCTMYICTYIPNAMGLFNRGVTRIKKAQKLEVSTFNFVVSK